MSLQSIRETEEVCSWHSTGHSGMQFTVTANRNYSSILGLQKLLKNNQLC